MFDLVELSRHPAVFLVHLDALSQRHTGGHWLQEATDRDVTSEIPAIKRNKTLSNIEKTGHITHAARGTDLDLQIPFSLTLFLIPICAERLLKG